MRPIAKRRTEPAENKKMPATGKRPWPVPQSSGFLPEQLCSHLKRSCSAPASDFAIGTGAAGTVGLVWQSMIQRAECICPPLERQVLPDRELLERGEIEVGIARSRQVVAALIAERAHPGLCVAGGFKIFGVCMWPIVAVAVLRSAHLNAAAGIRVIVGGYIEREAALHCEESTYSPAAELVLPPLAAIQEGLAF